MKTPLIPREKKLSTKLTQEQIEQIPLLRKQHFSINEIAEKFGVSTYPVYYWLKSDDDRKDMNYFYNKTKRSKMTKKEKIVMNKSSRESIKRKALLLPDEMQEFWRKQSKLFRMTHPETIRKYFVRKVKENPDFYRDKKREQRAKNHITDTSKMVKT